MEMFFPEQRWTSEGEPELGVGIVSETAKGRVKIHFPAAGETRLYAAENSPLRRVVFKPGDTIVDTQNRPLLIERVQEGAELIIYIGEDRALSEADLGEVAITHGLDDRLAMGEVDSPQLFALRKKTLQHDHQRRISPINGFVGGRIDLIPHQLYIAHEVSGRFAPRVLLSDEVGLGKTIEACLILHRLLVSGRIKRVLILVPESLVHQWFVEMLRRFNLWFHIFDEERCVALEESAPEGNPFLDDQLIICSTGFLSGSESRARQAISADWDMLVVDEAHHLDWSVDQVSPAYAIVELLSKVAKGLLLLTATPEQLGLESHFARLRLLDPERYADWEAFKAETQDHKEIADIVEQLSTSETLNRSAQKQITQLFGAARLAQLSQGGAASRQNLIEDLLDQHGPGRVIFRNTRSAMSGFPHRKAHLTPLSLSQKEELWQARLAKEFSFDIGTSKLKREQFWFDEDPRMDWLLALLQELDPAKVLLICRSKAKALAIEKALLQRTALNIGVFHEELNIVQRDRNAAWFAEKEGARILICSEIGSEGRNFQFAHHLVLFDLPFHPELLEQRIGRLDRIGQTVDIQIHIPYVVGSPQEVLAKWFHAGLNAFEESQEGGNQIAHLFAERLLAATEATASQNAQLESLIEDTAAYQQNLKQSFAQGRDRLLEMNSFRPELANKLIAQIRAADIDPSLENFLNGIFEHYGVEIEDLAPRTYLLHPSRMTREAFPAIPDEGISITFDRKRALSREDISFVSWDHPMATGAIDMILSLGTGAVSFGVLRSGGAAAILLEALFVLETTGGQEIHVDRFLPTTPLRIVVDHSGEDLTDLYPDATIEAGLIAAPIDPLLENETLMEVVLPNMIDAATAYAENLAAPIMMKSLQNMHSSLEHEINRLQALQVKNNHIRPAEIQSAMQEQSDLAALIKDARIRLDAIQLIQKM
ncbi:MAG: RNA polymerase-associated protein RapA [Bacteroidota bacterium]